MPQKDVTLARCALPASVPQAELGALLLPARPCISIVTCSFQQGRFLEQAMRSVLDQDYPLLEYLVVDGGSTDGSVEIIRRHQSQLAWWVSEPDRGQTDALIKGFRRSTGDILGWLCSDDLLLPGVLHTVARFFATHRDVMAVYGDALWIDDSGRFLRPKKEMDFNHFVLLHDHNYIPQPSMFWRRELYEAVGGLNPDFDLAMDTDLWDRFAARTRIEHIPLYFSCMRYYPEQKTRSQKPGGSREGTAIRRRSAHPLAAHALARPLLRLAARLMRVSSKALAGGYTARVPEEHLAWLRQCVAGGSGR